MSKWLEICRLLKFDLFEISDGGIYKLLLGCAYINIFLQFEQNNYQNFSNLFFQGCKVVFI